MSKKTWDDQPDLVTDADILLSMHVGGDIGIIEVRRLDYTHATVYLLSLGSLFGSQTIEAPDADTVFRLIEMANKGARKSKRKKEPMSLPAGCKLLGEGVKA